MSALLDLVARCEAATGPDRELEGAICAAVRGLGPQSPYWQGGVRNPVPHYTASLDAAMTLVPEGWTWDVDATAPELGVDWTLHEPKRNGRTVRGTHSQPALALCAAALAARALGEA